MMAPNKQLKMLNLHEVVKLTWFYQICPNFIEATSHTTKWHLAASVRPAA